MTEARERAEAALERVKAMLVAPAPETPLQWALRAPTDPDAVAAWLREAPEAE